VVPPVIFAENGTFLDVVRAADLHGRRIDLPSVDPEARLRIAGGGPNSRFRHSSSRIFIEFHEQGIHIRVAGDPKIRGRCWRGVIRHDGLMPKSIVYVRRPLKSLPRRRTCG